MLKIQILHYLNLLLQQFGNLYSLGNSRRNSKAAIADLIIYYVQYKKQLGMWANDLLKY